MSTCAAAIHDVDDASKFKLSQKRTKIERKAWCSQDPTLIALKCHVVLNEVVDC